MHIKSHALSALALGLLIATGADLSAQPKKTETAAKSTSPTASILRRQSLETPWQVVKENEGLPTGQLLLMLGSDAAVVSQNGAVRLADMAEMGGGSPFPVIETAVILHAPDKKDLDFSLDRGRVMLTNLKKEGAAHVRVRIREQPGEIVLKQPGSSLALEIYGRWPAGAPFSKEAKPGEGPALGIVALALKGEVEIHSPLRHFHLTAPPGPAMVQADNFGESEPILSKLDKLPDWADGQMTEQEKRIQAMALKFRAAAVSKSIDQAVDVFLQSKDPMERRAAILVLGALDELAKLGDVLATSKSADTWDAAVLALRHWIGRGPGMSQKLYQGLIDKAKYPPAQAAIVLHLLHGFSTQELTRPETYEMLIDYLESDRLAIRGLADWHLDRLVPQGATIKYDPQASAEEREKAAAAWRKLIPPGKVPGTVKKEPK